MVKVPVPNSLASPLVRGWRAVPFSNFITSMDSDETWEKISVRFDLCLQLDLDRYQAE